MLVGMLVSAAWAADVESVRVVAGRPSVGSVVGTVSQPMDVVLAKILDCDGTSAWFPNMLASHLVEQRADGYTCSGATDLPWPLADRTWTIDVSWTRQDDGSAIATFEYLRGSGNLAEMSGRYLLEPAGASATRVTYEGRVNLGFWLPPVVLDWATSELLPQILTGLERGAPVLVAER